MFDISEIKITEIQRFVNVSKPGISKYFKNLDSGVTLVNNRIVGISPGAVSDYLEKQSAFKFFNPSIILSANLCGGVGKTSSITSIGAALRRVTSEEGHPIVFVDGDPQGSFTQTVFGEAAKDDEPILIDYLDKKVGIEALLNPLGKNMFFVKSNLNSAFIDKTLSRPADIKKEMKRFYTDIFDKLGSKTKILQDHTPQLSNLFASSVCALYQMPEDVVPLVLVPLRADSFALQGARYIISEIEDLHETYGFSAEKLKIHCFFSSLDRRISTSADALKAAMLDDVIKNYLSPVLIRYSSEIPKSINLSNNIFSKGKINNATDDYQDLLQYIYSQ